MEEQTHNLILGDSLEKLKDLEDNSIDTIITDPPYGLSFMGKKWDYDVPSVELWQECLRVLKPGGTALIFAGSRTQHRMAVNVEDAGFELFDTMMWIYGQGFPKSHNIKKALEKKYGKQDTKYNLRLLSDSNLSQTKHIEDEQGQTLFKSLSEQGLHRTVQGQESEESTAQRKEPSVEGWCDIQTSERELQRCKVCKMSERVSKDGKEGWICNGTPFSYGTEDWQDTPEDRSCASYRPQSSEQQDREPNVIPDEPTPQDIRKWEGYGTALKPSYEPIICARKPVDKTYANNALKHGVSGLNIDGGRIPTDDKLQVLHNETGEKDLMGNMKGKDSKGRKIEFVDGGLGRFPANIILDEEAGKMLDEQSGVSKSSTITAPMADITGGNFKTYKGNTDKITTRGHNDKGGASRFFYCAKASKKERNKGCEELEERPLVDGGLGRFPANIILDEEAGKMLDEQSGELVSGSKKANQDSYNHEGKEFVAGMGASVNEYTVNKGGASRFFYCAKASKKERNKGCEELEERQTGSFEGNADTDNTNRKIGANPSKPNAPRTNHHPTVKPLKLMEYLCTLTKTPTGGTILDPFMGSGTTGIAAINTDRDFIGIEREEEYLNIAQARISKAIEENTNKLL